MTADDRTFPPPAGDERSLLSGFLDLQRTTLLWKVRGVDAEGMRRTTAASSLTLAGLLKHMALVEESWFSDRIAGRGMGQPWCDVDFASDPDWEFRTALDDDPEDLIAAYEAACASSREVLAATDLDAVTAWVDGGYGEPVSVRWVVLHMIEETARHNGHADLLREAIDGATGE